jgi:hypothetical protein
MNLKKAYLVHKEDRVEGLQFPLITIDFKPFFTDKFCSCRFKTTQEYASKAYLVSMSIRGCYYPLILFSDVNEAKSHHILWSGKIWSYNRLPISPVEAYKIDPSCPAISF